MANLTSSPCRGPSCLGFSLLEVLISLSILATGILGMTALQQQALKLTHGALLASQAQFLLQDMVERIRANPTASGYAIDFHETPGPPAQDCTQGPCSGAEMAHWDVWEWYQALAGMAYLPAAEGRIEVDGAGHVSRIAIRYQGTQGDEAGTGLQQFSLSSGL